MFFFLVQNSLKFSKAKSISHSTVAHLTTMAYAFGTYYEAFL